MTIANGILDASAISEIGAALSPNTRVALIGDSRADRGRNTSGNSRNLNARGMLDWARFLTRQRFDHNLEDIYATTGQTSEYILENHLPDALASGAGTIVCIVGVNDRRVGGIDAATTIANLTAIRDAVLLAGRRMVFIADTPTGTSVVTSERLTSPQLQYHNQVHDWMLSINDPSRGVYVVDPWPVFADQTVTTGDCLPSMMLDGLHPVQYGAYYGIGVPLAELFNQLFPPRNILPSSLADAYDATNNPRGVLTANVTTAGTGGTITAPAAGTMTGDIADSYTAALTNGTGLSVVLSKVTDANGKIWQEIEVSGTPTSASPLLTITLPSVATLAGDVLDVFSELQVEAGQTGVAGITLGGFAGTESINFFDMDKESATDTYPTAALEGVMRSPRYTRTGNGSLIVSNRISFRQNVAVSATIRIRALGGRKVI